jgi:hypothetical protein
LIDRLVGHFRFGGERLAGRLPSRIAALEKVHRPIDQGFGFAHRKRGERAVLGREHEGVCDCNFV